MGKEHLRLLDTDRLLDLGCGPGWLAIAFALLCREVVAVDLEPSMLEPARAAAAEIGVRIEFIEASSYDLGSHFGMFQIVIIGRAFHWMDRSEALRKLNTMIEPNGAIVFFNDVRPEVCENLWYNTTRAIAFRPIG
jgi:2-polyprenyl-3-methyl-5-hydroxy-6-metoxy-1,4-benzoquinol methylase